MKDAFFPSDVTIDTLQQTAEDGLGEEAVAAAREAGEDNRAQEDPGKSVWQIVASNLFTLFNLLNFALAACLIAVGSYRNMLFMGVVISNTLIGTVQELRAHKVLKKLQLLGEPMVRVRRNGQVISLHAHELVKGDRVVLEAGNQVPADGMVLSGSCGVNESMLTGESDTVSKERGAWLISGSFLTEGQVEVQLVQVGEESYINRLSKAAHKIKRPKSALMTDLNKLVRLVSIILVPLGCILLCKQVLIGHLALEKAIPSAVGAMIGMIPEGLMLLTSMALTVGVIRLGRRQTLVQELYGIETLARADVLCLDKTGTITTGEMALEEIETVDASAEELGRAMCRFLGAFDTTSPTLSALRKAYPPEKVEVRTLLPFSSARKCSGVTFADGTTYVMGAPNFVLSADAYSEKLREQVRRHTKKGQRVMVLIQTDEICQNEMPQMIRVMGLLCLTDTIRDHAEETLQYFREQGVDVRIISGDDPETVAALAGRISLPGAERFVDASTLRTEEELVEAADRYTVFGRVTPDQKRRLVMALKAKGHSVAMTGDGVNDIPALKAADCSIAMAGGSDAAKHAAQLTLLNPDFDCLPAVVGEGRRVVNNITRAASLFLVKTLYSFALAVLTLVLPAAYPFQPIQLTAISSLTIGIPTFFLAMEPNREPIRGKFLETVLLRAIPGAAAVAICATVSMMMEHAGWDAGICSTMATVSAAAVGLLMLLKVCLPLTKMRGAVFFSMLLGMVLVLSLFGHLFYLVPLSINNYLVLAGLIFGAIAVMLLTENVLKCIFAHHHL